MQMLPDSGAPHKRIRHYALYDEASGIATLVRGGFAFQTEEGSRIHLVRYADPKLTLLGRCDLADEQHAQDLKRRVLRP